MTLVLGNAWSSWAEIAWLLHGSSIRVRLLAISLYPAGGFRACQNGELGRMGKMRGLGKHMTHSPRAVVGSQPSPACGSGLYQQQKNNTLPKRLGPIKGKPSLSSSCQHCASKCPAPSSLPYCSVFMRAIRCLRDLKLPAW